MIYGYPAKEVNEYGLLEMKEITFSASPVVLREIARFLAVSADLMDAGDFETCSHQHIQSVIPDWDRRFPESDIVVVPEDVPLAVENRQAAPRMIVTRSSDSRQAPFQEQDGPRPSGAAACADDL